MGTSNFYNKNASKVYAICMPYEYPKENENGEAILNEDGTPIMEMLYPELEDELDYITGELKELKYEISIMGKDSRYDDNDRNFYGKCFAHLFVTSGFIEASLRCFARSGYYEGANLDWELYYNYDGYDITDERPTSEHLKWYFDDNDEFHELGVYEDMLNELDVKTTKLIADVEAVYAECSTPLNVFAQFSNGETWYSKAEAL